MPIALADESSLTLHSLRGVGGLRIDLLRNGCIQSISRDEFLISQLVASPLAGGVQRIYLRIFLGGRILFREIVGPRAHSDIAISDDRITWSGEWQELHYICNCWLDSAREGWIFRVQIRSDNGESIRCDALIVQDIGVATRGQVRNNELFTSQYIDHLAERDASAGWLVMSRQTLPQSTEHLKAVHPWLMHGCFPSARGFATDGLEFFGASFKDSIAPAALSREIIGTQVCQREAACVVIQSSDVDLQPGTPQVWDFFALFSIDHAERSSRADCSRLTHVRAMQARLNAAIANASPSRAVTVERSIFQTCEAFRADSFDVDDLDRLFSDDRRHEEIVDGELFSFFYGAEARHVVLREKELASARPHGHILRTGRGFLPDSQMMSSAFYAGGVFASQLAIGNSSVAKFVSVMRDQLGIVRSSGLRMFMRYDAGENWKLLGVPSAFEMALDECCWHYKDAENLLKITCRASHDDPALSYEIDVDGRPIELLVSGEIVAGSNEYDFKPTLSVDGQNNRLTIRPYEKSPLAEKLPALAFHVVTSSPDNLETLAGDELLMMDSASRRFPYFAIQTKLTRSFDFTVLGTIEDSAIEPLCAKFEQDSRKRNDSKFWHGVTAGARLAFAPRQKAEQLGDVLKWFARDALVHLSTPRGLEQANGGAWGVRDVCQGPVEFLLAYNHCDTVREILRMLFSRQFHERRDWPQWFGFPPFQEQQAADAHGDVLIWPLKALYEYLQHTNDGEILNERLPYTNDETIEPTDRRETVLEHVDRLIDRMREQFVKGLSLPRYGEGDWDDSLQPADPHLAEAMVSSWTSALMFQTLRDYSMALKHFGEGGRATAAMELSEKIKSDFHRLLMPDGIVAGFAVLDDKTNQPTEFLLHPSDTRTHLRYRLIPITRGIISGIFSPEEARRHLDLIRAHLLFPDGARLMDRPTEYRGGEERTFRRAESAAFFGREIGLQYVHAHLRYAQALAVMGRADELFEALMLVNPIGVTELVKGAQPRQRNCYFSSSDAKFADRYQASRDYDRLRTGEIETDGGWRIYSSGPGIYTNLVIRHLFGLRRHFEFLEFDPVLPRSLDGAACEIDEAGRRVRYQFSVQNSAFSPLRIRANGVELSTATRSPNPYRAGGVRIARREFDSLLMSGDNLVEIEL